MDCGMRGMGRKGGWKRCGRRGKRGGCGEDGAGRKCGLQRRRSGILYIGILVGMIFLHIAAWSSSEFCDWYLEHVFGIWVDTYGRLVGLVPFSVGEVLLGAGAGFGAVGVLLGAIWLVDRAVAWGKRGQKPCGTAGEVRGKGLRRIRAWGKLQRNRQGKMGVPGEGLGNGRENRSWLSRACRAYCRAGLWMLLWAFVLMTLNCYILYHGSGFSGAYLIGEEREYTFEELAALRNFVVEQCNRLCCQMPRKEDGTLFYEGEMLEAAKAAMRHLGETYESLGGFYPTPKPLRSSDFMSQQHIAGCYYPFSMEANYNDVMYVMNLPSTLCHELGHLKGYIREDEANLIGYLACVQSEDPFFQYSGYLSVLYYVDRDFRQAMESGAGSGSQVSWQREGSRQSENAWQNEVARQKEAILHSAFMGERRMWEYPDTSWQAGTLQQDEALRQESAKKQPETQRQEWIQVQILPQVHADNIFLTSQERTRIEKDTLLDTEAVDAISDSIADASLKLNGVRDGMISYSRVVELLLRYYDIYGYP